MSTRPPVFTWNEDLHFGPPSELVCIQKFLDDAEKLSLRGIFPWLDGATSKDDIYTSITGWRDWQELSDETRASVELDCKCVCIAPSDLLRLTWTPRLDDIKAPLAATLKSQKQGSYLHKTHAAALRDLTSQVAKKGKEREQRIETVDEEIEPLKRAIEQTQLKIWRSLSCLFIYLILQRSNTHSCFQDWSLTRNHIFEQVIYLSKMFW